MSIEKAILIATKAHMGQIDKGGNSYILHPLRVMLTMTEDDARIVAVLHDVIEDTEVKFEDLRKEGFSEEIILAVDHLTRREGESYMEFIRRVKLNDLARLVKMADIDDNKNISRITNPTEKDFERIKKYNKALSELMS